MANLPPKGVCRGILASYGPENMDSFLGKMMVFLWSFYEVYLLF
jgi:hypothetical protein